MVPIIQPKRRVTGASIPGVIICKLNHWKEPGPIVLLKIDKGLKVRLHNIDLPLSLPICLWVEHGRKLLLDAKEIVK